MHKSKIKKGDQVIVISGSDKGKQGKVLSVLPKLNKAVVSGINIKKKHSKPTKFTEGGIISKEMPIDISNIAHIDPKTNTATKVGFKILDSGEKVKFAKKSKEVIG